MNIDWSKAPKGATHCTPVEDQPNRRPVFWRVVAGIARECWAMENDFSEVRDHFRYSDAGCQAFIPDRSVARPWSWGGEGLPPVGTVCEFAGFNPEETTFDDPSVGDKITVIAHYLSGCIEVAAFTYNCAANFGSLQVAQGAHGCFRPIRTAEQVAADKRLHEIRNALTAIKAGQSSFPNDIVRGNITVAVVEAMIDAGYRKQVQA
jgi:hypothetical protein